MGDERIEVLKMVADKLLTVEEAERLLRALDEGDRKRAEPAPRRAERRSFVAGAFDGMGEALGAIGEVVEATLSEAVQGVECELGIDDEELDAPSGPTAFELQPGARISVRQYGRGSHRARCSLTLLPSGDGRVTVEAEPGADLRTRPDAEPDEIRWRRGALTVRIPATASEVDARLLGGELQAHGVPCALEARTMGGRMEVTGVRSPFDLRSTGGDLVIGVGPGLTGESRAGSMGGAVVIAVGDGLAARIEMTTTGGEARVEAGLGRVRREGLRYHGTTVLEPLEGEPGATIAVKSVGGDVVVKRGAP